MDKQDHILVDAFKLLEEEEDMTEETTDTENVVVEGTDGVEVKEAELPSSTFVVEVITNGDETIRLSVEQPEEAQKVATTIAKRGTYHTQIENGVQVYGVKSVAVTGPYEIRKKEEEPESDAANDSEQ